MPTLVAMPQKRGLGEACPYCPGSTEVERTLVLGKGQGRHLRRGGLEEKGVVVLEDKERTFQAE